MKIRVNRRHVLTLMGGAAALPFAASAQGRVYRVGSITPTAAFTPKSPLGGILIKGFEQRGYVIGKNLEFDARGADGRVDRLPALLQEFVNAKVDVIIATGYPPAALAKLTGIPTVVTHAAGDPVATGLIASMARPGGTVTGISDNASDLTTKRLQLLKDIAPGIRRIAMLWNRNDLGMTLRYEASAKVAQALGVSVQALGVREPDDFEEAFAAMRREMPDAILMVADALTILNRRRVFEFAAAHKLPAIYEADAFVRDGGLMSYGADLPECFDRAAALADRILKGAKPADLPFEHPTRFKFTLNLRTAKAMGLTVPNTALALADEVIE